MAKVTSPDEDPDELSVAPLSEPLTVRERVSRGKAARARQSRAAAGDWRPSKNRRDPLDILAAQARTRIPELVPVRYGRMLASPFAFYRGAAAVMAADLSHSPISGLTVQTCGDAQLANFGMFAAPDRSLVFDINDFDETLPGPWEWDVKRLVASLELAARDNGFSDAECAEVVADGVRSYREAMGVFADMRNLDVWYLRLPVSMGLEAFAAAQRGEDQVLPPAYRMIVPQFVSKKKAAVDDPTATVEGARSKVGKQASDKTTKNPSKAATRGHLQALGKLTTAVDGKIQFVSTPPMVVPIEEIFPKATAKAIHGGLQDAMDSYLRSVDPGIRHLVSSYRLHRVARQVVGVGSVGTRSWVALMLGRDERDPLLLQVKEAQLSVLEPFVGASALRNAGQRVVVGQRLMQTTGDIFLGWQQVADPDGRTRDYYVRQLRDGKGSADVAGMNPPVMRFYAALCGWTLARAHARSGDRVAVSAYLGSSDAFDSAMGRFAKAYADTTEADHAALVAAVEKGKIKAEPGA